MFDPGPNHRPRLPLRLLLAIAVIGCGLVWSDPAEANSPARPGHHCACGKACRGASCCCSHEPDGAVASEVKPLTPTFDLRPCVEKIPCGGGESPTISVGVSASKAIMTAADLSMIDTPGETVATWPIAVPSMPCGDRLDDPPDHGV